MIELYPHQESDINKLREELKRHKAVLLRAPTGYGKTAVACYMIKSATERAKRTIFMVHRKELTTQTSKTLYDVGIQHSFIAAGMPYSDKPLCHVAIINSLHRRLDELQPPEFLIVDEAHLSMSRSWSEVVEWAKKGGAYVVGLTATPWRMNGDGLKKHFDAMIDGPSVAWLIENKFLSDYRVFAPTELDTSKFHIKQGEYAIEDVENEMMKPKLIGDVVANWLKYAGGQRTVVFAPSVKVSEEVVRQFRLNGIPAAHLDANIPKNERKEIVEGFADGKHLVLSNVNIMTEGFDLSSFAGRSVPIEAVILYTPTMSLSRHLQSIGRALRPKPYPAIIIDHTNNIRRHGFPTDDFDWSLEDRPKRKRREAEEPKTTIRTCPKCYYVHPPSPCCPECGHIYEVKSREIDVEDGELDELLWKEKRKKRAIEERACKTLQELVALGKARGYQFPYGWAKHKMRLREGKKATIDLSGC